MFKLVKNSRILHCNLIRNANIFNCQIHSNRNFRLPSSTYSTDSQSNEYVFFSQTATCSLHCEETHTILQCVSSSVAMCHAPLRRLFITIYMIDSNLILKYSSFSPLNLISYNFSFLHFSNGSLHRLTWKLQ